MFKNDTYKVILTQKLKNNTIIKLATGQTITPRARLVQSTEPHQSLVV